MIERGRLLGTEIAGARRFVARTDQFIASRIDARNGAMGIVPAALDGAVVTNDFPLFDVASQRLLPAFLNWLSKTAGFVELCLRASEGTTNRVRLKEERFLALEIPLPPLAEQRRLVDFIERVSSISVNARRLSLESSTACALILRAAAQDAYEEESAQLGLTALTDVCESITDGDHNTPPFTENGIPFIFVGNVSSGSLHFAGAKRVGRDYFARLSPSRVPRRGDILYSAVGATLGVPALVDTDEAFCFQRHIAILRPRQGDVDSHFVMHMLRSRSVFDHAWAATTGSAQPTIPLRAIRELTIPVPPLSRQRLVVERLESVAGEQRRLESALRSRHSAVEALLPSVMDRVFSSAQ